MTSAYDMFYGGTSGGYPGEKQLETAYRLVMPGALNDLKNLAKTNFGKGAGVLVGIALILAFMCLIVRAGPVLSRAKEWSLPRLAGIRRTLMGSSGFEGLGAAVTGLGIQTHLGSLDGQMAQRETQKDRFGSGGEPPVFWESPSYVLRKDELLNNAMGDYGREKSSGATALSFGDWMTLNASRYATFGESANNLAALGRDISEQKYRTEGLTAGERRRRVGGSTLMGMY